MFAPNLLVSDFYQSLRFLTSLFTREMWSGRRPSSVSSEWFDDCLSNRLAVGELKWHQSIEGTAPVFRLSFCRTKLSIQ